MASLFIKGETKVRAGVYRRYTTSDLGGVAGADDGTVAVVMSSDWGPMNKVVDIESVSTLHEIFGTCAAVKKTAERVLNVGAKALKVVRVGSSGTAGSYAVKGGSAGTATVANLTTKYASNRAFSVTIREKLGESTKKEFITYEGTTQLEKISFETGTSEIDNFVSAINESSSIFTATKETSATGEVKTVSQDAITAGTNPTVNTEAYSTGFTYLEATRFNVLCVDSSDTAVHSAVNAFITRVVSSGGLCMAVIGEPISVAFATRISHAAAFNNECIVYVGGSAIDTNGNTVEGYEAAAIVAGIIASTTSANSIVHSTVPGMAELKERLTDNQHIQAIESGCIMFSESMDGTVWIESGVNTLINPSADQDEGWKKIKRVKVRHELFDRIDRTLEPIVGKIRCDNDGIANIIKLATDVMTAMNRENKITPDFSFIEDPERPHGGDSAWFLISCDDLDSLEKIYLAYTFRYSSNS